MHVIENLYESMYIQYVFVIGEAYVQVYVMKSAGVWAYEHDRESRQVGISAYDV